MFKRAIRQFRTDLNPDDQELTPAQIQQRLKASVELRTGSTLNSNYQRVVVEQKMLKPFTLQFDRSITIDHEIIDRSYNNDTLHNKPNVADPNNPTPDLLDVSSTAQKLPNTIIAPPAQTSKQNDPKEPEVKRKLSGDLNTQASFITPEDLQPDILFDFTNKREKPKQASKDFPTSGNVDASQSTHKKEKCCTVQ